MTVDLVLHFLRWLLVIHLFYDYSYKKPYRQGSYSGDGGIVVLCAYLGQLVRMRDALAGKVVTVIDERDQETIAAHEEDREDNPESLSVNRVSVTRKVSLVNVSATSSLICLLGLTSHRGQFSRRRRY